MSNLEAVAAADPSPRVRSPRAGGGGGGGIILESHTLPTRRLAFGCTLACISFWSIIILFTAILLAIYYIHNISPLVIEINYVTLNTVEVVIPGGIALSSLIIIMAEFSTKATTRVFTQLDDMHLEVNLYGKVIGRNAMVPPPMRERPVDSVRVWFEFFIIELLLSHDDVVEWWGATADGGLVKLNSPPQDGRLPHWGGGNGPHPPGGSCPTLLS